MGLSSFNRMRREKSHVEVIEAERFKIDNEARNQRRVDRDEAKEKTDALQEKAAKAEAEAVAAIGEKNLAGMETKVIDQPLRQDHAAEIAGRNLFGVQEPKDPVARVHERIPLEKTANEVLVDHTQVDGAGPTAKMIAAAEKEAGVSKEVPAPAPAEEDVAPKGKKR